MEQKAHNKPSCFVIAVNGASGAGKSALVKTLAHKLGDSVPMHFDDYSPRYVSTSKYPADIVRWVANGADPNAWETPQLVHDLRALRRGEAITLPEHKGVSKQTAFIMRALRQEKPLIFPREKRVLQPARFIVLEEPFGREREAMKDLIDFVIALDTPLEIALARRLLEVPHIPYFVAHSKEQYPAILEYLHGYLYRGGRELYITVNEQVRKNCDMVLDGTKPIDELADEAVMRIRAVAMVGE